MNASVIVQKEAGIDKRFLNRVNKNVVKRPQRYRKNLFRIVFP